MPDLCPTHRITGFWCPLCGGTRATAALLRGDLGTALAYNPFALATEVVAVLFVARWPCADWSGAPGRSSPPPRRSATASPVPDSSSCATSQECGSS
ncbi:DUF2752 domain-containing protein [Actinomyces denticolens]|uniref:DUF2752 domain-containing protein n=1 Tax=Actinomyces denticolens TaxID=52767 RepID=UPI001FCA1521|nr:DUF2752 domain-containing protein [Actinomyces denticolens]